MPATRKPAEVDVEPQDAPEAPPEVSEARQKWLAGELTWREYLAAEEQ